LAEKKERGKKVKPGTTRQAMATPEYPERLERQNHSIAASSIVLTQMRDK
jgi:hypothetical protein